MGEAQEMVSKLCQKKIFKILLTKQKMAINPPIGTY